MAGTKEGGLRAAKMNKKRYGKDYYKRIGSKGGSVEHRETRKFYTDRELARKAGSIGGKISRKYKKKPRKLFGLLGI